ncbi:MAG: glycosyltransferase, partial [Candidatus Saccharibacteria bacterium]
DVVFTKGGFVCLPVGFAAKLLRIPLVIHDSDAHPGLTNRVLAKWATSIATGAPLEHYDYPKDRSRYIGIPIANEFKPFSKTKQIAAKQELGIAQNMPLIVVTGGGLGATRINNAVVNCLDELLKYTSVILVSGTAQYDELAALTPNFEPDRFQLHAFVSSGMDQMLGAADVVVARAGATTLLELAGLAKPTILVPNGYLTGGHQLKNAAVYTHKNAAIVIDEHDLDDDASILTKQVRELLADDEEREKLAHNLHLFARPHAAKDLAAMIEAAAK